MNVLLSLLKDKGGSRDETKNDIRALPEVLTVTLVEPEKGGIQRDIGTKYLTSLKLHIRLPKNVNKKIMMKTLVNKIGALTGISVLRYQERLPRRRRTPFHGEYKITEGDYYQSPQHARDVTDDAAELTGHGGQEKGGSPFKRKPKKKKWRSAPPGAPGGGPPPIGPIAGLEEEIKIRLRPHLSKMLAFDIRDELNKEIWEGDERLHPDVREALVDIAQQFIDETELEEDIKDITFTGSLANYNWSNFSDIDLHLIVDFEDISDNTSLVRKFFDAVKSNWNKLHDITVKGHEVEIYVQNEGEPHISTGVYSVLKDEWIVKPKRIEPTIDKATAYKKAREIQREIDKIDALYNNKQYEEVLDRSYFLKDKIKRMRRAGLARTGLFAPENLAFKMLRRSGHIETLFNAFTGAYDSTLSLAEEQDDTHQD